MVNAMMQVLGLVGSGVRSVLPCVAVASLWLQASPLRAQSEVGKSAAGTGATADVVEVEDVTPEQERVAREMVERAHLLHQQFRFEQAAMEYKRALRYWAHPAIHFALGQIYLSLVKAQDAYRHLQQAVSHGPAPLGNHDFQKAQILLRRLESEISQLEVHCFEPGTRVTVNGEDWLVCPGMHARVLRSGSYVVQADKPDYKSVSHTLSLFAGMKVTVEPNMVSVADSIERYHRWRPWKPWLVLGAGVAVGLTGGVLQWRASSDFSSFDAGWTERCTGAASGCEEPEQPALMATLQRARLENQLAIGAFVAGGVTVVAGLTLVILNRAERPNPRAGTLTIKDTRIVPLVSGDSVGTSLGFAF